MKPITRRTKTPVPHEGARAGTGDAAAPPTPTAWVLYDADCPICTRFAQRFQNLLARRNFTTLPLQTPWARKRFKSLSHADYLAEMRLLYPDGKTFGGADALIEISRHYWWAWPTFALAQIPPIKASLRAGYRWFAQNRGCHNNACAVDMEHKSANLSLFDFLPLIILPLLAMVFRPHLAPWVFMWAMGFAIFGGCKWLTYREAVRRLPAAITMRTMGYLFAWPGMDAIKFLRQEFVPTRPRPGEWAFAVAKTIFGAALIWGVTRTALPYHLILAGWIAMTGIIFLLHFGLFHVLSLAWRRCGVEAPPIMDKPIRATSLNEFWGKRWNTAFNTLAFRYAFRPLRHAINPTVAVLIVFLLSGAVHELMISLPANAGYGLPTIYFLIQGLGMIVERTPLGRRIGLGRGARGWTFTLIVAATPAYWLFHPPFIKTVILPMLHAIGAT